MNKKHLYETIMKNVSKQVKRTLNENDEYRSVFCNLTIEFSEGEAGMIYAYIGDDIGGSGIELSGDNAEELAEKVKFELLDYIESNI